MQSIKRIAALATLALAATALLGVSSASATIHVKACYGASGLENCLTIGTKSKFVANGTNVKLANPSIEITCSSKVEGEILTTLSENGTKRSMRISFMRSSLGVALLQSVEFPTFGTTLGWLLLTDAVAFPKGLLEGGVLTSINVFGVKCSYVETATDMVHMKWTNGDPSSVELSGELARESGSEGLAAI